MVYENVQIFENNYKSIPVGTIIQMCSSHIPTGYLLCDGSQYKVEDYPELATILNASSQILFNVPDLRECALVGVGQNQLYFKDTDDTDEHDLKKHDEYDIGTFKNDELQLHQHGYVRVTGGDETLTGPKKKVGGQFTYTTTKIKSSSEDNPVRVGTVTRGKRFGVNFVIKF